MSCENKVDNPWFCLSDELVSTVFPFETSQNKTVYTSEYILRTAISRMAQQLYEWEQDVTDFACHFCFAHILVMVMLYHVPYNQLSCKYCANNIGCGFYLIVWKFEEMVCSLTWISKGGKLCQSLLVWRDGVFIDVNFKRR